MMNMGGSMWWAYLGILLVLNLIGNYVAQLILPTLVSDPLEQRVLFRIVVIVVLLLSCGVLMVISRFLPF